MKRTRFGARDRNSLDAADLQRLATGLAESGGKLEDAYWEKQLAAAVDALLSNGAEDDLNTALDRLAETNPRAHDELADMIEGRSETHVHELNGQFYDVQLFAAPILAWSRFAITTCNLPESTVQSLGVQLGAHVFSKDARLMLADLLFSPDQLPRNFHDTWRLTRELGMAALLKRQVFIDSSVLPETNRFLSDVRYLLGAIAVPRGSALFRWNEIDGNKEEALRAWRQQGGQLLEPQLTGCVWEALLPDAYHAACRNADRASRQYSVKASVEFLHTVLGLAPEAVRAVIGPCYDKGMEEYRVGLGPTSSKDIFHGIVWPLLGGEDENSDIAGEIEAALRETGVKDVRFLDHHFPMEFCDDCGAPLFPNIEGELVHAEMPEQASDMPQVLH